MSDSRIHILLIYGFCLTSTTHFVSNIPDCQILVSITWMILNYGGRRWIRTTDVYRSRFLLCRQVPSSAWLDGHKSYLITQWRYPFNRVACRCGFISGPQLLRLLLRFELLLELLVKLFGLCSVLHFSFCFSFKCLGSFLLLVSFLTFLFCPGFF